MRERDGPPSEQSDRAQERRHEHHLPERRGQHRGDAERERGARRERPPSDPERNDANRGRLQTNEDGGDEDGHGAETLWHAPSVRRVYGAAAGTVSNLRLRLWALKTDLRMRAHGGRFKLELQGSGIRFRKLPYVRIRADGRGGTTVVSIGAQANLGVLDLDLTAATDALLSIGDHTEFERGVRLQLFGRTLEIGPSCEFRDNVVLKTSRAEAELRIAGQVRMGRGVEVHCNERVHIDERVTIAERVSILDLFHDVDGSDALVNAAAGTVGSGTYRDQRHAVLRCDRLARCARRSEFGRCRQRRTGRRRPRSGVAICRRPSQAGAANHRG